MSLLESWNWCFFLSPWMLKIFEEDIWFHRPNPRVASFIPPFLGGEWGGGRYFARPHAPLYTAGFWTDIWRRRDWFPSTLDICFIVEMYNSYSVSRVRVLAWHQWDSFAEQQQWGKILDIPNNKHSKCDVTKPDLKRYINPRLSTARIISDSCCTSGFSFPLSLAHFQSSTCIHIFLP
jgi:hypothetical protein